MRYATYATLHRSVRSDAQRNDELRRISRGVSAARPHDPMLRAVCCAVEVHGVRRGVATDALPHRIDRRTYGAAEKAAASPRLGGLAIGRRRGVLCMPRFACRGCTICAVRCTLQAVQSMLQVASSRACCTLQFACMVVRRLPRDACRMFSVAPGTAALRSIGQGRALRRRVWSVPFLCPLPCLAPTRPSLTRPCPASPRPTWPSPTWPSPIKPLSHIGPSHLGLSHLGLSHLGLSHLASSTWAYPT